MSPPAVRDCEEGRSGGRAWRSGSLGGRAHGRAAGWAVGRPGAGGGSVGPGGSGRRAGGWASWGGRLGAVGRAVWAPQREVLRALLLLIAQERMRGQMPCAAVLHLLRGLTPAPSSPGERPRGDSDEVAAVVASRCVVGGRMMPPELVLLVSDFVPPAPGENARMQIIGACARSTSGPFPIAR